MAGTMGECKPITGFPNYLASNTGEIYKVSQGKIVKIKQHGNGKPYRAVWLATAIGSRRDMRVHVLVANAFHGERPKGMQVNHKNGIKTDNRSENLEYVTPSENNKHARENGLHVRAPRFPRKLNRQKVVEIIGLLASNHSRSEIGRMYGVNRTAISKIAAGKNWVPSPTLHRVTAGAKATEICLKKPVRER